jgi:hypothetical protein
MSNRNWSILATGLFAFLGAASAHATTIVMNFDSLQNFEQVNNYYNGGFGSLGSGPGPNYGVTFSNALVLNEFMNNEGLLVSPPNSITFLSGTGSIMNDPASFTTGFSFNYSAVNNPGVVTVWSGLNGTGTLLASLNLPLTPDGSSTAGCGGHDFCPDLPFGVTFSGVAESVNFSGTANQIVYDDITLGSPTPLGSPGAAPPLVTPLPAALPLFSAGIAGLGAAGWLRRRRQLYS